MSRARSAIAVIALVLLGDSWRTPAADLPLDRLLASAGDYVRRFERTFAYVISDEEYSQHATGRYYVGPLHRRTRAEMLFLWLPDEAFWLTVRNVLDVDGLKVVGSDTLLSDAMSEAGPGRLTRLRRLVNESARFNVGRTFRNFNYPTLVLSYLDPVFQPRFTFTLAGTERVRGVRAWKVNFAEHGTPTIIQGDGADRVSRGTVWIAERDGVLLRTQLDVRIPRPDSSAWGGVAVDYAHDANLDMFVPVRMHETYTEVRGSVVFENIGGDARYFNFRRFETSGRIVAPE